MVGHLSDKQTIQRELMRKALEEKRTGFPRRDLALGDFMEGGREWV